MVHMAFLGVAVHTRLIEAPIPEIDGKSALLGLYVHS